MPHDLFKTITDCEKAIKRLRIKRQLTKEEREQIALKFEKLLERYQSIFD